MNAPKPLAERHPGATAAAPHSAERSRYGGMFHQEHKTAHSAHQRTTPGAHHDQSRPSTPHSVSRGNRSPRRRHHHRAGDRAAMSTIETIEVTFNLSDGRKQHASIFTDAGWMQWGATTEQLGETVETVEAMAQAAAEAGLLASDHDDDDDDDDGPEYGQTVTLTGHDRPVYLSDDYGPVDDMDGI